MRCDGWSVSLVLGAWLLVEEKRLWRKFFFFFVGWGAWRAKRTRFGEEGDDIPSFLIVACSFLFWLFLGLLQASMQRFVLCFAVFERGWVGFARAGTDQPRSTILLQRLPTT